MGEVDVIKVLESKKEVLKGYKEQAEATRSARIRNEANLENLIKTENDIIDKIKKLGYDPENLKNHIQDKITELNIITDKLAKVMPDDNGNIPEGATELLSNEKIEVRINDNEDRELEDFPF